MKMMLVVLMSVFSGGILAEEVKPSLNNQLANAPQSTIDWWSEQINSNKQIRKDADTKYKIEHPNCELTDDYLKFQVNQRELEYTQNQTMYTRLCETYKLCQNEDDKAIQLRLKEFQIAEVKNDFELLKKQKAKEITEEERLRLHDVFSLNHKSVECETYKQNCEDFELSKTNYKKTHNVDYIATEGTKTDVTNTTTNTTIVVKDDKNKPKPKQQGESYIPSTCKWAEDMPRRLAFCPGCEGKGSLSSVCVGYIVCDSVEKDAGKFIRMATCSDKLCGTNDAVACTKQGGYGSEKPVKETKTTVGDNVREDLAPTAQD